MDELLDIIKDRSMPGILILNDIFAPVYMSTEARELFGDEMNGNGNGTTLPPELLNLCNSLQFQDAESYNVVGILRKEIQYLLRATPLYRAEGKSDRKPSHIMVVIEKCAPGRSINIKKVVNKFGLTTREGEVVAEVVKGVKNSVVADELCISEHTVKDHLKKVMEKMAVGNRASIITKLFE